VSSANNATALQPPSFAPESVLEAGADVVARLSAAEFAERYVAKRRAVLIKGGLAETAAFRDWTFERVRRAGGEKTVLLKDWGPNGELMTFEMQLSAYLDEVERYEAHRAAGETGVSRPAYLHDVPLTDIFPTAAEDLAGFPSDFFPDWYGAGWTEFAQFFLGPSTSLTPLHFDCLLTHNLFFQLRGRKRFIVLDHAQLDKCYPYDWRWCAVDPEAPDFDKYPLYRQTTAHELIVEPGDVFYMPAGMLHHVRSLDAAISFNVDWHTRESAISGALAATRGMPWRNVCYNLVLALGLWTGVSRRRLMPFYKSYLSYVS
jgi:hypothetical protein